MRIRAGSMSRAWIAVVLLSAGAATATLAAGVSPAVREYRLRMFDPGISTLANRSIELMFDTRTVRAGNRPSRLPVAHAPLDFQYDAGGTMVAASAFAERTFTDALLIMKDGRIVHEQYLNRTTGRTRFMSYSMAKSLNSIMTGIAIAEGRIGSVDDPVLQYLPELRGTAYDGLSLKHLLWMRTGARWDDNFFTPGPSRDAHVAAFVEQKERYFSAATRIRDRAGPPGVAFNYNSVEASLVGEIVSRATRRTLSDYLSEKLWRPAGMESDAFYVLDGTDDSAREFTAGGFNATLRDYGRIGQMMLDRGKANGRQLLPPAWVDESTRPGPGRASVEDGTGYAYLWWTIDGTRAFTMLGGEGQFVYVDPEHRTVIVKLSHVPVGSAEGTKATAESFAFLKAASVWQPGLRAR